MLDPQAVGLQSVGAIPYAVIDIETTGLVPGADRIVEVAVVRLDPGEEPRLVLDTLVNPRRPMAATEIHGITEDDVARAPTFSDIVGDLVDAVSGCCLAAYNAVFDMAILRRELRQLDIDRPLPHLCIMGAYADLGFSTVQNLEAACREQEIAFHGGHIAAYDALSEAHLLARLLPRLEAAGVAQLGHFLNKSRRGFCESLVAPFLPTAADLDLAPSGKRLARRQEIEAVPDTRRALGLYFDALQAVVADGQVTAPEADHLDTLKRHFGLSTEQVRSLHARLFATLIALYADDAWLAESEADSLRKLHGCLSHLGWAPGE